MSLTKKLILIICILFILLMTYVISDNINYVLEEVDNFVTFVKGDKIIIPEETYNVRTYDYKTFKMTDNFKPTNKEDIINIYYTVLNSGWDSFKFYCPSSYKDCISDVKDVAYNNDLMNLMNNYVSPYNTYDNYNTFIIGDNEIQLTIDKLYSESEINTLKIKVNKIASSFNIDKDNYSKDDIMNLHNYIINSVTYDSDYEKNKGNSVSNKAIGAINNGTAVCSGYADLFGLLLDEFDIPNFKVSSADHIWNVIYFENGWYHIDTTWDDDEINKLNTTNFFLLTTDNLLKIDSETHAFNKEKYLELN